MSHFSLSTSSLVSASLPWRVAEQVQQLGSGPAPSVSLADRDIYGRAQQAIQAIECRMNRSRIGEAVGLGAVIGGKVYVQESPSFDHGTARMRGIALALLSLLNEGSDPDGIQVTTLARNRQELEEVLVVCDAMGFRLIHVYAPASASFGDLSQWNRLDITWSVVTETLEELPELDRRLSSKIQRIYIPCTDQVMASTPAMILGCASLIEEAVAEMSSCVGKSFQIIASLPSMTWMMGLMKALSHSRNPITRVESYARRFAPKDRLDPVHGREEASPPMDYMELGVRRYAARLVEAAGQACLGIVDPVAAAHLLFGLSHDGNEINQPRSYLVLGGITSYETPSSGGVVEWQSLRQGVESLNEALAREGYVSHRVVRHIHDALDAKDFIDALGRNLPKGWDLIDGLGALELGRWLPRGKKDINASLRSIAMYCERWNRSKREALLHPYGNRLSVPSVYFGMLDKFGIEYALIRESALFKLRELIQNGFLDRFLVEIYILDRCLESGVLEQDRGVSERIATGLSIMKRFLGLLDEGRKNALSEMIRSCQIHLERRNSTMASADMRGEGNP